MSPLSLLLACAAPEPDAPGVPPPAPTPSTPPTPPTPPVADPARCAPALTPTADHWVEGDTVVLELGCTSDDRGIFAPTLLDGPPGARLDGWTLSFPTDLDDAGPVALFLSVSAGEGLPETLLRTVEITDAGPGVDDNPPPDRLRYTREFGLPVLHLDPLAALSQEYVPAEVTFEGVAYPDARVKIRGAASAGYPKPSYTLAFDGEHLDGGPLGLPEKDHLVLISNFDDVSHLRQKLVYDTWAAMAEAWGEDRPVLRTGWVVVYQGGAYHGLYLAIDHVDDEFFDEHGLDRDGDLFKSVNHDANWSRVLASGAPKTWLGAGWEKKEGLDPDDFGPIEDLTAFAADADAATFAASAADWIAVPEFMDWFLLVAFAAAADSAGKNAYVWQDLAGGPLRFVPWDFNHAFGQSWTTERVPVETWSDYRWNNRIFDHFQTDPGLSATLWGRYDTLSAPGGPLDLEALLDRLDAGERLVAPSAARDWEVWEAAHRAYGLWSSRTDFLAPPEETAQLRAWVAARGAVMDARRP